MSVGKRRYDKKLKKHAGYPELGARTLLNLLLLAGSPGSGNVEFQRRYRHSSRSGRSATRVRGSSKGDWGRVRSLSAASLRHIERDPARVTLHAENTSREHPPSDRSLLSRCARSSPFGIPDLFKSRSVDYDVRDVYRTTGPYMFEQAMFTYLPEYAR